ncbi:MAG TPA: methionyl-tRNA formyltransferase [Candidatus Saccharimonadales bacterium]|jgi:methionyl-tRNA formyltransferase|nr:methionyl-tRNA formyltransferase [Candidatus Saccharimonadales bacterium]
MQTSSPLIFFGTEDFSAVTLQTLIDSGWPVAAVITKPNFRRGRSQQLAQPKVKDIALAANIPVWQPHKLIEVQDDIKKLQPVAGVLVSYGKIIPQSIIDLFTPGIINVHPSLLPKYRGPSPIESAIVHDDSKTGVSIMSLSKDMDAGPVYSQKVVPLTGHETKPELYHQLATIGANLLVEKLPAIISGELTPQPQHETAASYCKLLTKADGLLLPDQKTANVCEREVRAYLGYPKSRLSFDGHDIIVTKARVAKARNDGDFVIACADNTYLEVQSLVAPSGRTVSGADFLRGHKKA